MTRLIGLLARLCQYQLWSFNSRDTKIAKLLPKKETLVNFNAEKLSKEGIFEVHILVKKSPVKESLMDCSKGQSISKGLFDILNSPKKRTNKLDFATMI